LFGDGDLEGDEFDRKGDRIPLDLCGLRLEDLSLRRASIFLNTESTLVFKEPRCSSNLDTLCFITSP
jgi:hypothetical protein